MKKQHALLMTLSAGLFTLGMAGSADAALLGRLETAPGSGVFQAYYDDVANLTWLADANYAQTSGYAGANANGTMTWYAATTWAAQLTVGGVGGWRLPDTLVPDDSCSRQIAGLSTGFNCTGSEMGNLFYNVLGGVTNTSITTTHNANFNLFSNVQSNGYWSATVVMILPNRAWDFNMGNGDQGIPSETSSFYGWAVQLGDVSAVPVPAAVWLFGSGLLGLIGIARRKK